MKSNPEITIDDNHVYRDSAGRVVLGVTGIIRACGLMDSYGWNDYTRDRGTAVHKAVELYERGTLDEDSLDPVILPYLDGWRSFRAGTGYESETLEQIVYSPLYRYAGTLDQTGFLGQKTCVLDIKTGPEQLWWALQTAAYNGVAKRAERYSLMLPGDGKWKLIKHENKSDWQVFLACLTVAGWRQSA
jgi:hypothetical protein